jgi:hypothetical protein
MRRFIALLAVITVLLCSAAPALAIGFGISPPEIEFTVPADASKKVEFTVYDFEGNLRVSLENIPLRVEPTSVPVESSAAGTTISLTFYGDESLGSKIYQGKIRFLALTGGMVATGIKVRATVTNLVEGETPVLVEPEETSPEQQEISSPSPGSSNPEMENQGVTILPSESNPEQETSGQPIQLQPPPPSGGQGGLPVLAIAGIAVGAIIIITLIIVLSRRPRY